MSSASFGNHWSTGATTSFIFVTGAGNFSVAQTVNNCTSAPSSLTPVFVNPLPQVNLGTFAAICVSEILVLNQGQPAGGIYSGNLVSGTTFSVPAGSSGFFNIKYTYTDVNGCANSATSPVNVSECVGISPVQTANNLITVFPNPGTGHFSVFSGNTGIRSYTVRDLNGKLILDSRVNDQKNITVDISEQPQGIYLLELFSENGPVRSLIYKND